MAYLLLVLLGLGVGTYGTLIGAGGGFILVPILLFIYPSMNPATITAISLLVVFFNAGSGSFAYARQGKVDFRTGVIFALATVPGAVAGALVVGYIPRQMFNIIFGTVLLLLSLYIILRPTRTASGVKKAQPGWTERTITDAQGNTYEFAFPMPLGIAISVGVGFLSSLLGIGGGIIHVPALVQVLNFPVHIATATSHFILAIMALVSTIVHLLNGELGWDNGLQQGLSIGLGAVIGAQVGAFLSHKVHGVLIIRLLGAALLLVAIRLLLAGFVG